MEVLAAPTPMSISPSSSTYTLRKSRSLLARRISQARLSSETISSTLSLSSTAGLSSNPSVILSNATAVGISARATRGSSATLLPFVPLTPIMASPRMTPDIGSLPGPLVAVGVDSANGDNNSKSAADAPPSDYLTLGHPVSDGAAVKSSSLPPPSWTSTPPTPPLKGVTPPCDHSDANIVETSPTQVRTRSRSRTGHIRPASVAVFPIYRPPSPPPLCLFEPSPSAVPALPIHSSSPPRPSSATVARKTSFTHYPMADPPQRRQSLPRNFGKFVDVTPSSSVALGIDMNEARRGRAHDEILPPSVSRQPGERRGRNGNSSPLGASVIAREESTSSSKGRRMFILDDGEASEGENDAQDESELPMKETIVDNDLAKVSSGATEVHGVLEWAGSRRYHALMELLVTEVGYLMDLRVLVSIYLAQLPSLTVSIPSLGLTRPSPSSRSISNLGLSRPFPSSRSSFLHGSSPHSGAGPGPPADVAVSQKRRETSGDKEAEKDKENKHKGDKEKVRRALLSDREIQIVRRNCEQLLALHHRFVGLLRDAVEPLGFGSAFEQLPEGRKQEVSSNSDTEVRVDQAVGLVADVFSSQAPSFAIYESFCPRHNEAANLVRNLQEHYPVEWDAYEQRCSLHVAHEFELNAQASRHSPRPENHPPPAYNTRASVDSEARRKRRHSTSSVAILVPMSPIGGMPHTFSHLNIMSPTRSDPLPGHKRKASGGGANTNSQTGRLKFLDYLIKPVQRLCKYPLLLDQLRVKRIQHQPKCTVDIVEEASHAIRTVVGRVDQASELRTHLVKSELIASRLAASSLSSSVSTDGHDDRPTQLSLDFLRSLGPCFLSGALDVVYPQSGGNVRSKYLGAFLYAGGYLILSKVPKNGKTYDPKHWFALAGFEVIDEEEDDIALPYAFHLCSGSGYHLHLAAACQLEKTIWMASIQDALSIRPSEWINEPVANLPVDARLFVPSNDEPIPEWLSHLPTIQSMSELDTPVNPNAPAPSLPSPRKLAKTISRVDGVGLRQEASNFTALSRRTSTSSVKAFFAPLSFDSRVTRPSSQIRQQVDHGLQDVLSDPFVTVRSQAHIRDEELFQVRKKPGNMSRSNSGLSITGAFTARRRYDSTVLAGLRRKTSLDGIPDITSDLEGAGRNTSAIMSRRPKSNSAKRMGKVPLSVVPSMSAAMTDVDGTQVVLSPEGSLEAPSPMTQCSSASSSNAGSVLPSPADMTIALPLTSLTHHTSVRTPSTRQGEYRPKRARSMVDNVKYFFHSRSLSPAPSLQGSPKIMISSLETEDTAGGLVQWWRKGSLRRRVQSSPEVPIEESAPATPAASSEDSHSSSKLFSPAEQYTESPTASPDIEPQSTLRRSSFRRVAFSDATPIRRRSLFSSSSRSDFQPPLMDVPGLGRRPGLARSKTLKNIFNFQRSNSFSPHDLDSLP